MIMLSVQAYSNVLPIVCPEACILQNYWNINCSGMVHPSYLHKYQVGLSSQMSLKLNQQKKKGNQFPYDRGSSIIHYTISRHLPWVYHCLDDYCHAHKGRD